MDIHSRWVTAVDKLTDTNSSNDTKQITSDDICFLVQFKGIFKLQFANLYLLTRATWAYTVPVQLSHEVSGDKNWK